MCRCPVGVIISHSHPVLLLLPAPSISPAIPPPPSGGIALAKEMEVLWGKGAVIRLLPLPPASTAECCCSQSLSSGISWFSVFAGQSPVSVSDLVSIRHPAPVPHPPVLSGSVPLVTSMSAPPISQSFPLP